ncbi:upstream activation factor subunit uaf30 [Phtheirospermum japonicum]|uniref:Upstream activation factor subunit uaf30 n=1 Tax=Phtheirospermum japonicum TaxID=374723 RepID=A0A830AY55_9LAMI|nr:upstream activation factor subunit uaf30 [Phtheirospermum japonicum]
MAFPARIFGNKCRALMAAAKSTPAAAAAEPKAPSRAAGIQKLQPISPALAKFLGSAEASRTDAVKKVWEYIKSNNLQNPANKKEIYCDDKLKAIFDGNDKVNFQGVAKLLANHFRKTT